MKAELNVFDEWLKNSLWRDLLYKFLLWTIFTIIIYTIAASMKDFDYEKYFYKSFNFDMRVVNIMLPVNFIPVFIAGLFKDMEIAKSTLYGQHRFIGKVGSFLRRLTTDMLLWFCALIYGVTIIMFISLARNISHHGISEINPAIKLFSIFALLILMECINVYLYIMLRQSGTLFFNVLRKNYITMALIYVTFGAVILFLLRK